MLLAMKDLFKEIDVFSKERDYMVKLSYVEIYNEVIKDLMNSK
jgi:hypothetical protein